MLLIFNINQNKICAIINSNVYMWSVNAGNNRHYIFLYVCYDAIIMNKKIINCNTKTNSWFFNKKKLVKICNKSKLINLVASYYLHSSETSYMNSLKNFKWDNFKYYKNIHAK